jgi:hypothetical protein
MSRKALFPMGDALLACALQKSVRRKRMTTLRLKQEVFSFISTFWSCIILSLILGGIGGTIYKAMAPDGWLALAFGRSLSAGAAALGSMLLVAGLAWFSRSWGAPGDRGLLSHVIQWVFAGIGVVYLVQILSRGAF